MNDAFGSRCVFDEQGARFPQVGITLAVLEPGKPSGLYHSESAQEAFLVLRGRCRARVEGEERELRQWDFLHCPPGTEHVFVGTDAPCVLLMLGARFAGKTLFYPDQGTTSPREAYASLPTWQPGTPPLRQLFP